MIYAYIRVSTDKQHQENQKYKIEQFASANNLYIDKWIEETISSKKPLEERKLDKLIKKLKFAFGLSAEIERNLISQRTKQCLAIHGLHKKTHQNNIKFKNTI